MIQKEVATLRDAVADIGDGSTVMIGGFGTAGLPNELVGALLEQGAKDLTVINNNAGNGDSGLAALIGAGRVRRIVCSFPRQADSHHFDRLYRSGGIELELVPQGNLAERIRAAGAGIGGFFTPTGYGTDLAKGKETREIDGRMYVLESPLHADYAFIKAERGDRWGNLAERIRAAGAGIGGFFTPTGYGTDLAKGKETREIGGRMYVFETPIHADLALIKAERGDRWGNLTYRKTARNFGPVMAMAARITVASVHEVVELGGLDPEHIVTPGIFVQRVVCVDRD